MSARTTPISPTKTQALARVLSAVSHGYSRLCMGTVIPEKLTRLVSKFDRRYGIADTKGQRVIRKRAGLASTQLTIFAPPDEYRPLEGRLAWILLATPGEGVEEECWTDVQDHPIWIGYELVRHNDAGEVRWSWRRPKVELTALYAELGEDLARHRYGMVQRTLERIAHQPGFHGVRAQSQALVDYAVRRGYQGPLPHLFYVQKVGHGRPMEITHQPT
jgi:hypothetical protein